MEKRGRPDNFKVHIFLTSYKCRYIVQVLLLVRRKKNHISVKYSLFSTGTTQRFLST
jgi:hypothetical protein